MELRLGLLASHNGSNVEAILHHIKTHELDAEPKVIISNNKQANVLRIGKEHGIPSYCINAKRYEHPDQAILETLLEHNVNLVVLAGYMKPIGKQIIDAFPYRILNLHPALLPKYGGKGMYGMHVNEAVIASGDLETGVTIHLVTEEIDAGPIVEQYKMRIASDDTPETLARRVQKLEHFMYSKVLDDIQKEKIQLDYLVH